MKMTRKILLRFAGSRGAAAAMIVFLGGGRDWCLEVESCSCEHNSACGRRAQYIYCLMSPFSYKVVIEALADVL